MIPQDIYAGLPLTDNERDFLTIIRARTNTLEVIRGLSGIGAQHPANNFARNPDTTNHHYMRNCSQALFTALCRDARNTSAPDNYIDLLARGLCFDTMKFPILIANLHDRPALCKQITNAYDQALFQEQQFTNAIRTAIGLLAGMVLSFAVTTAMTKLHPSPQAPAQPCTQGQTGQALTPARPMTAMGCKSPGQSSAPPLT